jgi:hypothetical protein
MHINTPADPLAEHMRKTVKSVMKREDAATEAICVLVRDTKKSWTLPEWNGVLDTLDHETARVQDWLPLWT